MRSRMLPILLFLVWATLLGPQAVAQHIPEPKPLTTDDVLEMVHSGFSEETIVQGIRSSRSNFDTSVAALKALKAAGVSERIIQAMLAAKDPKPVANADPATPSDIPNDVGVYLVKPGRLVEMHPDLVTWRTGGVVKSMFLGTKGHINGVVKGSDSQLRVAVPVEFFIRCPENIDIAEYQLLRLNRKKDRREFRALTGGYVHVSSGADENALPFKFEKVAPRTYKISLPDLPIGEYGFLPPAGQFGGFGGGQSGAPMMGGTMTSGKLYTFSIIE